MFRSDQYGMQWGILWSIAVEEQFYLFFPLLIKATGNTRRLVFVLLLFIVAGPFSRGAGNLYFNNEMQGGFSNSFACFDLLAIGVLLFITFEHTREFFSRRPQIQILTCLFGLLLTSLVFSFTTAADPVQRVYGPTLLGAGIFLFLLGGLQIHAIEKIPRWSVFPGELSYGMYLYHPLIIFLLWSLCIKQNELLSFSCMLAVLIAISAISFYIFEKPVNKLICKNLGMVEKPQSQDRNNGIAQIG